MGGIRTTIQKLGGKTVAGVRMVGQVVLLLAETAALLRQGLPDRKVLIKQLHFVGVLSLPVVLTTGTFTGMVMAYALYPEFGRLGVTVWVGAMVAKALAQQLGPTLTGLMLAGRVGCAMAAELGYMTVSEQVDALKTMGVNPVRYLVAPRVLALAVMSPLLTGFAIFIGIAGGILLVVLGHGAEWHFIWSKTVDLMNPYDFVRGLTKAFFYGLTTSAICCYMGLNARGGAQGVGEATTNSNVYACITILVLNLFLTMVLGLWAPQ